MPKPVELPFGKTIYQSDYGHSITSDTAFFVDHIKNSNLPERLSILELGCGNGIISIMLAHYFPNWQFTAIDIQPKLVQLARKNARLTNAKIAFLRADLRTFHPTHPFDLIVTNPPYFPKDQGKISTNQERAISRHEVFCTLQQVLESIARNLQAKGKAFLIYPYFRWHDFTLSLKKVDLIFIKKNIFNSSEGEKRRMILELKRA